MVFAMGSSWAQTLNEGFEGTTFPPEEWTAINVSGNETWSSYSSSRGNSCASVNWDVSGHENLLITPKLSVETGLDTIKFWLMTDSYYSGTSLDILISTTGNTVSSFNTTSLLNISNEQISTSWTQYSVPLTNYIGQNIYVAFKVVDNFGCRIMLDDVTGPNLFVPSCPRPRSLVVNNINTTSIDLGWTDTTGSNLTIQYMPANSNDWSLATEISNVTTNPYTISSLSPSSQYKFRVKTICNSIDESDWSNESIFTTACGLITAFPWTEGFESDWTMTTYPSNQVSPTCWSVVDKGIEGYSDYYQHWWKRVTDGSHTGSACSSISTYYGQGNHNDWLITPLVSLTGNERLRFWAMNNDATTTDVDEISVFISDTNITLDTVGMGQYGNMQHFTQLFTQVLPVGDWQRYEINLSQYSGNRYIAFVRQNTPSGSALRLDDVEISTIPNCIPPTSITYSNITSTSVDLSWNNAHATDNSWYLYYKKHISINYDSILVSSNPYTLSINGDSIYDLYIKTNCGIEQSEASSIISFGPECRTITDFPYTEGFENDWVITLYPGNKPSPSCWTVIDKGVNVNAYGNYQDYSWKRAEYSSFGTAGATTHTGLGSAQCYTSSSANNHNDWLISPLINLTGNEKLSFWLMRNLINSSEPEDISIFISDEDLILDTAGMGDYGNMSGFTHILTQNVPQGNWQKYDINLNQYTGNRYIAFARKDNTNGYYLRLDDVEISTIPSCSNPTTVVASNITSNSADISWQAAQNTDNSMVFIL